MISQEIIERVRTETDIVGLIGEYVRLKRSGRNFIGLCPFHKEKTPSFNVSPERQAYHCFGCGEGGNAITFIMKHENTSFPEAVKLLAERLGIRIEYTVDDDPVIPLVQSLEMAGKIYQETLWSKAGLDAQRYLAGRGLGKETVKSFGLGLVPQDTSSLLSRARELKLSTKVLAESGVLGTRSGRLYPFLAGRIVFPIHSASGRLVGFSGRIWGDDSNPAKYVNTPETKLFKKSRLLYGLSRARSYLRREGAIIVEGQIDVLKLVQNGFSNVVAPLGTAFTADHARILSRYSEKVTMVFDGDDAGRKAGLRALSEVLSVDLETKLLLLPQGQDPDSFLTDHSPQEFKELLSQASDPMPFIYTIASPETSSDRRRCAQQMLGMIKRIPDPLRREFYIDETAELIGVDRQVLEGMLGSAKKLNTSEANASQNVHSDSQDAEQRLLRMMMHNSEFVKLAVHHLEASLFPEGEKRDLLQKLYRLSETRDGFNPGELLDSLSPRMQSLVSAWSFNDIEYSREEFSRALAAYLYRRKQEILRLELRKAESEGDSARARDILGQLNELLKARNKIFQEI